MKKNVAVLKRKCISNKFILFTCNSFFSDFIMSYEIFFNILKYLTMYEDLHYLFLFYHFIVDLLL